MKFEVLWTRTAEGDLLGILEFIAADDPEAALAVLDRIRTGTTRLDRSPRRGRIVPELREHGIARYREIVINPWRVIYRVEEHQVYVLSVIDGRRNVEDILLGRLLG